MRLARGRRRPLPHKPSDVTEHEDPKAVARRRLERLHEQFPERHDRIALHLATLAEQAGVVGGRVLELRGRPYDHGKYLPDTVELLHLEPTAPEGDELPADVVVADITSCPELESGSFDAVFSIDVLEHVREPWLAAAEIVRLLKPGGFTYHSTLFSWRYHPAPADYWRFTPDSLTFLFSELDLVRSDFDTVERRRNLVGRGLYKLESDAFGGWRENWRVFYAGVKPTA